MSNHVYIPLNDVYMNICVSVLNIPSYQRYQQLVHSQSNNNNNNNSTTASHSHPTSVGFPCGDKFVFYRHTVLNDISHIVSHNYGFNNSSEESKCNCIDIRRNSSHYYCLNNFNSPDIIHYHIDQIDVNLIKAFVIVIKYSNSLKQHEYSITNPDLFHNSIKSLPIDYKIAVLVVGRFFICRGSLSSVLLRHWDLFTNLSNFSSINNRVNNLVNLVMSNIINKINNSELETPLFYEEYCPVAAKSSPFILNRIKQILPRVFLYSSDYLKLIKLVSVYILYFNDDAIVVDSRLCVAILYVFHRLFLIPKIEFWNVCISSICYWLSNNGIELIMDGGDGLELGRSVYVDFIIIYLISDVVFNVLSFAELKGEISLFDSFSADGSKKFDEFILKYSSLLYHAFKRCTVLILSASILFLLGVVVVTALENTLSLATDVDCMVKISCVILARVG